LYYSAGNSLPDSRHHICSLSQDTLPFAMPNSLLKKLYNDLMLSLKNIETYLLQLTIFLIPTNLAYHWYIDAAYINGRLVDYLLPKFYLSDLPIIILILIGLYRYIKGKNTLRLPPLSLLLFIVYLVIRSFFSGSPISSGWYVLKLIEYVLFSVYLINSYTRKSLFRVIKFPLMCAIIFQSLLGIYQYISHNSLIGYTLLGEPNLKSIGIAQTNWFGVLEVSPYGTTTHPNVLVGFLFIGMMLWLYSSHLSPTSKVKNTLRLSLISLSLVVIILSGSLNVLSGVIFISLLYLITKVVSRQIVNVIVLMCICGSLLGSVPFIDYVYHSRNLADNHSIAARYELNQVAFTLIKRAPLTGIGPNLFSEYVPKQTFGGQRTLFLQPVHHIGLLIWSETGLLGLTLTTWSFYIYFLRLQRQSTDTKQTPYLYIFPLVALVFLGSWDHYPLTIQTGQLLTTVCLSIPLLRKG
jgi:hypothetical protein